MKKFPLIIASAVTAASSPALAQNCAQVDAPAAGVIEIVQFRLADGVVREDFVAAAENTMPELCATEGFIGRILSEGADGTWVDHVSWENADLAQAAMAGAFENETLRPFIQAIDPDSVVLSYQIPVIRE